MKQTINNAMRQPVLRLVVKFTNLSFLPVLVVVIYTIIAILTIEGNNEMLKNVMGQLWVGRIVARPSWPRLRGLEARATKRKPPITDPLQISADFA